METNDMSDDQPRRRGPAPRPASEQRRHPVSCRLTDAELAELERRRAAVSRGEWLRLAAFGTPPRVVPSVNRVAWADLARTAGNLNQLARAVTEGRLAGDADLSATLTDLRAQLDRVRAELIGVASEDPDEM
jgi:hypothetical protein